MASLRADVEDTRARLGENLQLTKETTAGARALLETLASGERSARRDSLLLTVGSVFILGDWTPVDHTYRQALGSGDLALVRGEELRRRLAAYAGALEEVGSLYRNAEAQYYGQLEPFLVSNTIYSELAAAWWRDRLVRAPFTTDLDALARSRELWNLLTLKLELEEAVITRLERADARAAELAEALSAAIGGPAGR